MDVERHVAVFNAAVTTGDWAAFVDLFSEDAELVFVGPAAGPFLGRDAIAAAYRAHPPDDTIERIGTTAVEGAVTVVPYRWTTTRDTGTMHLTEAPDGRLARLVITFDA